MGRGNPGNPYPERNRISRKRLASSIAACLSDESMKALALKTAEEVRAEPDGAVVAARAVRARLKEDFSDAVSVNPK